MASLGRGLPIYIRWGGFSSIDIPPSRSSTPSASLEGFKKPPYDDCEYRGLYKVSYTDKTSSNKKNAADKPTASD